MYNFVLHLHSGLRWVVLLLLLIVVYRSLTAGKRPFNNSDKKFVLYAMIICDIMLLVGVYQWLAGPWGLSSIQANGMKGIMQDSILRFFAIEHPIGMLIAIIMVHIGKSYSKKNIPDPVKHKRVFLFFALALLIILVSLPWPFREAGAGRGWF
ncbi:MAG: hypothetical protein JST10_00235 [Bacteroidetes bacterium]|nr:hypothetical protein [Bacteroidota bacterium]MBS1630978.1 hypothetical protein [Bacteroidota bacterium]